MRIDFDPAKNAKNIMERSLSFERAAEFDFLSATFLIDERQDYGEQRQIAIGYLDGRLHFLCFVQIPDGIRVVSFRKANSREARKYDKPITLN
ncbi:hypothetical protein B0F88_106106 [Methylobacter tundripaludum]|uniref:Uncharacterized protein n=1 Tax=Methylobacter tundripaludum TaxID=173365 RepID=A0A2S6H2P4_9GAMM|nr:BrnT family toxin [Methylobacter tundripaludum]PPK71755.1 hypothetical protein B0F88_106106 [Methylobacter tundripaludum]